MNANDLTFGIEFETTMPAGSVDVGSYQTGSQVPWLPEGWVAKTDCSIRSSRGRIGVEFVSPVLKDAAGVRQVCEVVRLLAAHGARVNASTGLHVHIGWNADQKALARLVTLVANFETAIFASTGSKARQRNRYCGGIQTYDSTAAAARAAESYRYHVLNLTNLTNPNKRTVEFRAFCGTLNMTKVAAHLWLCLGMVERALKAKRVTQFRATLAKESSPIHRSGVGQTELTRLFYQLGWIKGRTSYTYGNVTADGAPSLKAAKRELMRLARKYDSET